MKAILVLAVIVLMAVSYGSAERRANSPSSGPTTTSKPKTTRSQATQCDDHAKYAVRKLYGSDQPIRTVSACRPNQRANTYTVSFSLADKQCSGVMVRVDANGVPTGDLAARGSCAPINRSG